MGPPAFRILSGQILESLVSAARAVGSTVGLVFQLLRSTPGLSGADAGLVSRIVTAAKNYIQRNFGSGTLPPPGTPDGGTTPNGRPRHSTGQIVGPTTQIPVNPALTQPPGVAGEINYRVGYTTTVQVTDGSGQSASRTVQGRVDVWSGQPLSDTDLRQQAQDAILDDVLYRLVSPTGGFSEGDKPEQVVGDVAQSAIEVILTHRVQ